MQIALHKCKVVFKRKQRVEASAATLQGLRESGVCSLARGPPQTPFQAGDWTKPQSLALGGKRSLAAVPALWCPPGTHQSAESCGFLGVSRLCVVCVVPQTRARCFLFPFFLWATLWEEVNREIKRRRRNYTNPESAHFSPLPRPPRAPVSVFPHLDQCSRLLPGLSALPSTS